VHRRYLFKVQMKCNSHVLHRKVLFQIHFEGSGKGAGFPRKRFTYSDLGKSWRSIDRSFTHLPWKTWKLSPLRARFDQLFVRCREDFTASCCGEGSVAIRWSKRSIKRAVENGPISRGKQWWIFGGSPHEKEHPKNSLLSWVCSIIFNRDCVGWSPMTIL
jgi:hypothetical protein